MKKAKDIMSEDVVYLSPEDSIFDAAKVFSELKIHGAPVVEDEKLVGMLTVSDIIRFIDIKAGNLPKIPMPGFSNFMIALLRTFVASRKFTEELKRMTNLKVKDIMTSDVITAKPSTTFLEIARIMDDNNVHRVPVIKRNKLVGIITASDLMKVLVEEHKKPPRKSRISRVRNKFKRKNHLSLSIKS